MPRIVRLYWCDISMSGASAMAGNAALVAIWPSPVDFDHCFEQAGFKEFSDSDDQWDHDWKEILGRMFAVLGRNGAPRLLNKGDVHHVTEPRWWNYLTFTSPRAERVEITAFDRVLLSTQDDEFDDAIVEFGDPPAITLRTGAGHPIAWLRAPPGVALSGEIVAREIADARPVGRRDLHWQYLIPRPYIAPS